MFSCTLDLGTLRELSIGFWQGLHTHWFVAVTIQKKLFSQELTFSWTLATWSFAIYHLLENLRLIAEFIPSSRRTYQRLTGTKIDHSSNTKFL